MPCNLNKLDRMVRIVIGLALLSLIFIGPQTLWGLVGIIPLATATVAFCPIYRIFGLSTCSVKNRAKETPPRRASARRQAQRFGSHL